MKRIFMSYTRVDRPAVARVVTTLRTRFDVEVAYDGDLLPGTSWQGDLKSWLADSDVMVLWATSASRTATGVADELDLAVRQNLVIVPVMVEPGVVERWGAPVSSSQGVPVKSGATPEEIAMSIAGTLGLSAHPRPDSLEASLIKVVEIAHAAAVINPSLGTQYREALNALYRWQRRRFQVAVVALIKAGKSTAVNAWLGQELLPMANVAETARVVRIGHDPYNHVGTLVDGKQVWRGARDISAAIKRMNQETRDALDSPADLRLEVTVAAFGQRVDDTAGRGARIEIIDTPGPNESGADHLRAKTEAIVADADAIVYVLDYTRLNTTDEAKLLESIAEFRKDMLAAWAQRMFFLVNKIDERGRHDQSAEQAKAYVAKLLSKHLKISVPIDRVYPVSAKHALLARLCLGGHLDPAARKELAEIVGGRRWERVGDEELKSAAPELLQDAGFPAAEDAILGFLGGQAEQLLARGVLDNASRVAAEVEKHLRIQRDLSVREREELKAQVSKLKERLTRAKARFRNIEEVGARRKSSLNDLTLGAFQTFRKRLDEQVAALGGDVAPGLLTGSFQRAWDAVRATRDRVFGPDEDAGSAIKETLDAIILWAMDEYARFRVDLEREAHHQQEILIQELTEISSELAREVDREVGEVLNIAISPVPIEIPPPSRLGLHEGIERELSVIVGDAVRKERRRVQEQVADRGFCGTPIWRTQWVDRYDEIRGRRMELAAVRAFLRHRFEQAFEASQQSAGAVVSRMVSSHVRSAEQALDDYVNRYTQTVQHQVEVAARDVAAREQADAELVSYLETLGRVQKELATVRR